MKKICVVTAARSEYGLLKWLLYDIDKSEEFELQLVVTGGHLSYEQGHTVDQITSDGFNIMEVVDVQLDITNTVTIAEAMGKMAIGFANVFEKIKPDYLIVLGDRYELLPICSTAVVMRIPIIHIGGGDITEGAIDDGIRNAVTMLSEYHFPGTRASAENIARMRGNSQNIFVVGEPGLDSFYREKLLSRQELAQNLGLDINRKWALMTYHSETKKDIEYNLLAVNNCIDNLIKIDNIQVIVTYANADVGGKEINEFIEGQAKLYPIQLKVVPSLGHLRYLSYMKNVFLVIGNSSSGILEAPFLNIPVINVGDRQKGRYQCENIIQCTPEYDDINRAINLIITKQRKKAKDMNYWGDGKTSETIVKILREKIILDN